MGKAQFTASPFGRLTLTSPDVSDLLDTVNATVDTSLERYENFWWVEKTKIDPSKWKLIKSRPTMNTYIQQQNDDSSAPRPLLAVGTTTGTVDDVMLGVVNPTLESMRLKASYTGHLGCEAVLSNVVLPSEKDPFRSVTVKWLELDMPFQSAGLVQNRDYVYVEATGMTESFDGERIGFHVLHSVDFPQTHDLPNRVRANMSICCFFRQARPNLVSVYVTAIVDPVGNGHVRRLVLATMATALLATLEYARCGQMKKLTCALDTVYSKAKGVGAPDWGQICVTCNKAVSRRGEDIGKCSDSCKLCFGKICSTCKLQMKLSFLGADFRLVRRKVEFCTVCMTVALQGDAYKAGRRQIRDKTRASKTARKMSSFSGMKVGY